MKNSTAVHASSPPSVLKKLPGQDLDHILAKGIYIWEELRGKRLFFTGATGFFGGWMLEGLASANRCLGLRASVVLLTRDSDGFRRALPHLANDPAISLHAGDIRNFDFPEGPFDLLIHGATTTARETFEGESPLDKFETLALGTRRVMEFASQCGVERMLFTSSGVIYGSQPSGLDHIPEGYIGGPIPGYPQRALAEGKRAAEFLVSSLAESSGIAATIARCFSFVGPRLPLNLHYALGNFIRDALNGGPILVRGDGTAQRAYLYASDLVIWLWTILIKGDPGSIYNVGSENALTIADLAHLVASCMPHPPEVRVLGTPTPGAPSDHYVPSTQLAQKELGLREWIDLETAIRRTLDFHSLTPS